MSKLKQTVKGLDKILKNIKMKKRSYREATAAALFSEGIKIDELAVKMVPVDTGRLRSTHYVAPPKNLWRPEVEVGFGTDYALPVHEKTEMQLKSGFPKFLEEAMKINSSGYKSRLANKIKMFEKAGVKFGSMRGVSPEKPVVGAGGPVKNKKRKRK